jgi:ABC-type phosphate/phosphonate transport system ATPase subunit
MEENKILFDETIGKADEKKLMRIYQENTQSIVANRRNYS